MISSVLTPQHERSVVVFGGTGLIGSALLRALYPLQKGGHLHAARWGDFEAQGPLAYARDWIQRMPALVGDDERSGCDFVFANGLTDSKAPERDLFRANTDFPRQWVEALESLGVRHARYLTIGTALETVIDSHDPNPYLRSKQALGQWMQAAGSSAEGRGRFAHLRLHTVYADSPPKPHMFLGQLAAALAKGNVFEMSSGEQLREYHHADDVALSMVRILERHWDFEPAIALNSGNPVRLADLARAVFRAFGREHLLKIGALPRAGFESATRSFERSEEWMIPRSRDPLIGVVEALRHSIK